MGNFLIAFDESNVIECANVRRETSVNAKDLTIDECGDSQHVEHPTAVTPRVCIPVLVLALVVKPVNLLDIKRG
jgi:hypothetical protein